MPGVSGTATSDTIAIRDGISTLSQQAVASAATAASEPGDSATRSSPAVAAPASSCCCCSAPLSSSLFIGGLPASCVRLGLPDLDRLGPGAGVFGAAVPVFGTAGDLGAGAGDGGAAGVRDRVLPDRIGAGLAAPAGGHRDRAAGRRAVDHLRHVGLLRDRAVHGAIHRAAADRYLRRRSGAADCSPGRRSAPGFLPPR